MKEIKLSKGFITQVDDEKYEFLNQWKWSVHKSNANYYAVRHGKDEKGSWMNIYLHHLIIEIPEGLKVDHIDRDSLNNQKSNLRICTISQNNHNKMAYGRSKYLGVSFHKSSNKFRAQIGIDYRNYTIGYYNTEMEAAFAYDTKAKDLCGEFANLNFK